MYALVKKPKKSNVPRFAVYDAGGIHLSTRKICKDKTNMGKSIGHLEAFNINKKGLIDIAEKLNRKLPMIVLSKDIKNLSDFSYKTVSKSHVLPQGAKSQKTVECEADISLDSRKSDESDAIINSVALRFGKTYSNWNQSHATIKIEAMMKEISTRSHVSDSQQKNQWLSKIHVDPILSEGNGCTVKQLLQKSDIEVNIDSSKSPHDRDFANGDIFHAKDGQQESHSRMDEMQQDGDDVVDSMINREDSINNVVPQEQQEGPLCDLEQELQYPTRADNNLAEGSIEQKENSKSQRVNSDNLSEGDTTDDIALLSLEENHSVSADILISESGLKLQESDLLDGQWQDNSIFEIPFINCESKYTKDISTLSQTSENAVIPEQLILKNQEDDPKVGGIRSGNLTAANDKDSTTGVTVESLQNIPIIIEDAEDNHDYKLHNSDDLWEYQNDAVEELHESQLIHGSIIINSEEELKKIDWELTNERSIGKHNPGSGRNCLEIMKKLCDDTPVESQKIQQINGSHVTFNRENEGETNSQSPDGKFEEEKLMLSASELGSSICQEKGSKSGNEENVSTTKSGPRIIGNIASKIKIRILTTNLDNSEQEMNKDDCCKTGNVTCEGNIEEDVAHSDGEDDNNSVISELEALNDDDSAFIDDCEEEPEDIRFEYDNSFLPDSGEISAEKLTSSFQGDGTQHEVTIPQVTDDSYEADDDDSVKDPDCNVSSEESPSFDGERESLNFSEVRNLRKSNRESGTESVDTLMNLNTTNNIDEQIHCGALDDHDMVVDTSDCGKRKKAPCYYCGKHQSVISRHLEKVHKGEDAVKQFAGLPRGNPERKKLIEKLRKLGEGKWNRSKNNDGHLIVARRPHSSRMRPASHYITCHNCHGRYAKTSIRHHRRACTGASSKYSRSNTVLSKRAAARLHPEASKVFQEVIFPVMREDNIVRLIRYDRLLVKFGSHISAKYTKQNQHDMIRSRLRLLGRLLRTMRELEASITDFQSLFCPKYYDTMILAVQAEAKFDLMTGKYGKPTVATTLGTYIKKVGDYFVVDCIKREDPNKEKTIKDFLRVHALEYGVIVNRNAVECMRQMKRQRKKPLPTTEDVKTLWFYLYDQWKNAFNQLSESFSSEAWLTVGRTSLIMIQIFNRKRVGEMERMSIEDLKGAEQISEEANPELYKSLTEEEKSIVGRYVRVEIEGKLDRIVPVLLRMDMQKSIDLLLRYRVNMRIASQNPFVFALPGYDKGRFKYMRACQLLRQFATACGAKHSERLRGTLLRKHMATMCASSNVEENRIFDIANFMGHSEDIHRKVYRQSVASRDLCSVSKFLESAIGLDNYAIANEDDDTSDESDSDIEGPTEQSFPSTSSEIPKTLKRSRKMLKKSKTQDDSDDPDLIDEVPEKKRRIRWTKMEIKAVTKTFRPYLQSDKALPSQLIRDFLASNPGIHRSEAQIRSWVSNLKKKN